MSPTPSRLRKLLTDPVGVLIRRARWLRQQFRYRRPGGYRNRVFWTDRLKRHGFDLRGVGYESLSDSENRQMYEQARRQFLDLCQADGIDLVAARVLDIGCGTGFYADILAEHGNRQYLGVDITDALLEGLRLRRPDFSFRQMDVTEDELPGTFDLVIMIDVTQHITEPARFSAAMQNIRRHLAEDGVFIVTSWLDPNARRSFYEISRPLSAYQAEFPGWRFSPPQPFRDKFIFTIRGDGAARSES